MLLKSFKALLCCSVILAIALPLFFCDLGQQPIGTPETVMEIDDTAIDSVTKNMRIFVTPSNLRASNTDQAEVMVRVYDDNHNPLSGREVYFSATHGIITKVDTTDEAGVAYALFESVPINAEARIIATIEPGNPDLTVGTYISLSGITIMISPQYSNALLNTKIPITITVVDGAGMPVPNEEVEILGATDTVGITRGDGTVETWVTRATEGLVTVIVTSLGAVDSVIFRFWETIPEMGIDTMQTIRRLRIFSSRSQLKANNSDYAIITAILSNERNNPLAGDTVLFSCNLGVIEQHGIVDSTGRTSVRLTSTPVNGTCQIVAEVARQDISLRDSVSITFSGITLELMSDQTNLSVNDTTRINVLLKDASGNPIGGDNVVFQITSSIGTFHDSLKTYTTKLDPNGKASALITSATAGTLYVQASALNTIGITQIYFATNYLSLDTSKSTIIVGAKDSCLITATYKDNSNNPVSGVIIAFATNAGTITIDSAVTDGNGTGSTWLRSSDFAGTATIQATALDRTAGSAFITVTFAADIAKYINLAITPDNIGVNGGVATLVATVTDSNGNMVSERDVNFKILKGPGGGEHIDKPVVATYNGVARAQLFAGSQPSQYRGCEVIALLGAIADTSKLTLSGEPYTVTISRPQDDTVFVDNAGRKNETTFEFFIGAVIQDINGNPVADGTKVQFSAVVSGVLVERKVFAKWAGISSADDIKPIYRYYYVDIPFEDINNNLKMDPSIDLDIDSRPDTASRGEDVNGDGVFDYDPSIHDYFFDFNGNGQCDPLVGENEFVVVAPDTIFADLNNNGYRDLSELMVDHNGNGGYDGPASGDFPYCAPSSGSLPNGLRGWETRAWLPYLEFTNNDFAVVIDASVVTKGGVASTKLTYPRQMARRLRVTVNAEANGIRDKDGERFALPIIVD